MFFSHRILSVILTFLHMLKFQENASFSFMRWCITKLFSYCTMAIIKDYNIVIFEATFHIVQITVRLYWSFFGVPFRRYAVFLLIFRRVWNSSNKIWITPLCCPNQIAQRGIFSSISVSDEAIYECFRERCALVLLIAAVPSGQKSKTIAHFLPS